LDPGRLLWPNTRLVPVVALACCGEKSSRARRGRARRGAGDGHAGLPLFGASGALEGHCGDHAGGLPEYNPHSEDPHGYWDRLSDEFPEFQFVLYDAEQREVIAEGHTLPCDWDGTPDGLGDRISAMIAAAFQAREAGRCLTALCALAAEVRPRFQGGGLPNRMLDVMTDHARDAGLTHLIAPVRPPQRPLPDHADRAVRELDTRERRTVRSVDPQAPRRADHQAYPALDAYHRTVAEWEERTGMRFPGDGQYTFPAGLAPSRSNTHRTAGPIWSRTSGSCTRCSRNHSQESARPGYRGHDKGGLEHRTPARPPPRQSQDWAGTLGMGRENDLVQFSSGPERGDRNVA
jgi:GNAT superfamily N-acetyltransferase